MWQGTQMKIRTISTIFIVVLALFGLCLLVPAFLGCDIPRLQLRIEETRAGEPILDFTDQKHQISEYRLYKLRVWRLDESGNKIRCVWNVEPLPGTVAQLKHVEYGNPP